MAAAAAIDPDPHAEPAKRRRSRTASLATTPLPAVTTPDAAEAESSTGDPAAEKPRRRRGGRAVAPVPDPAAAGAQPAEADAAPSDERMLESDAPKRPRSRRRRSRRQADLGASNAQTTPPGTETSLDEEEPAKPAARVRRSGSPASKPVQAATPAIARIVVRKGLAELLLKDQPVTPTLFFGNLGDPGAEPRVASEIRRAKAAGVSILSTIIELTCPLPPDDTVYEVIDSRLSRLLEANPDAFLLPRVVFVPADGWDQQYPHEIAQSVNAPTGEPSIASDRFWGEAENALRMMVSHVERTNDGQRVIGYHLERGEWFHPVDHGYDRSFANREGFRQWLRHKYRGSEVALRAAWFDGGVQFYTADIPSFPVASPDGETFFDARRERRWTDFIEYTSDVMAERIVRLSKSVKEASEHGALVSVCYGYHFEFGHTYSGHLSLGRLLSASSIDVVSGPPSYRARLGGESGAFPGPTHSFALHGKLWLSEDDTKTHLAKADDEDFNPRIGSTEECHQARLRAIGAAMASQTGIGWMDLWGDGWLDSEDAWHAVDRYRALYEAGLKVRRAFEPDVAIVLSESSLAHARRGEAFLRRLYPGARDSVLKMGVSAGFYLQSDIAKAGFPQSAKLIVFLSPWRLSTDEQTAIREKLQRDGKVLVWLHVVNVCDAVGEPEETAHDLVGMSLRRQSWGEEAGSRITDTRHPVTSGLRSRTLGTRERCEPTFAVETDDRSISVLAEYQHSGLPSLAARDVGEWKTVFCGEPELPEDLLAGLLRYAGIQRTVEGPGEYAQIGGGWLSVHAVQKGLRTIRLPVGALLYDALQERLVDGAGQERRVELGAKTTGIFYIGSPEEIRKLGLPGALEVSGRARRGRRAPASAPETSDEPPTEAPLAVDADAAGGPEEAPAPQAEGADAEEAEDSTERKRRRRRGSRGRRRRPSGAAEPAPEAPPAE